MTEPGAIPTQAMSAGDAFKSAGNAAANTAATAIVNAAANAAKPGSQSSEFKYAVGMGVLSAIVAGLKVLAVIPGPWTLPAIIGAAALTASAYAISRGQVKTAALQAAGAAVSAAFNTPHTANTAAIVGAMTSGIR